MNDFEIILRNSDQQSRSKMRHIDLTCTCQPTHGLIIAQKSASFFPFCPVSGFAHFVCVGRNRNQNTCWAINYNLIGVSVAWDIVCRTFSSSKPQPDDENAGQIPFGWECRSDTIFIAIYGHRHLQNGTNKQFSRGENTSGSITLAVTLSCDVSQMTVRLSTTWRQRHNDGHFLEDGISTRAFKIKFLSSETIVIFMDSSLYRLN